MNTSQCKCFKYSYFKELFLIFFRAAFVFLLVSGSASAWFRPTSSSLVFPVLVALVSWFEIYSQMASVGQTSTHLLQSVHFENQYMPGNYR